MKNVWVVADWHLSHHNCACVFKKEDGSQLRPFESASHMDEMLIQWHNEIVKPNDKVYVLGDVCISRKGMDVVGKFNGDKVLVKGNHDIFKLEDYTKYFRDVRAYHVISGLIMSHVPVHPDSLYRFKFNVHGHLHANTVKYNGTDDPRYLCTSLEQVNFRPINMDEIIKIRDSRKDSIELLYNSN